MPRLTEIKSIDSKQIPKNCIFELDKNTVIDLIKILEIHTENKNLCDFTIDNTKYLLNKIINQIKENNT